MSDETVFANRVELMDVAHAVRIVKPRRIAERRIRGLTPETFLALYTLASLGFVLLLIFLVGWWP